MLECHVDKDIVLLEDVEYHKDARNNSKRYIDFFRINSNLHLYNYDSTNIEDINILSHYLQNRGNSKFRTYPSRLKIDGDNKNPYRLFLFNQSNDEVMELVKNNSHLLIGSFNNYRNIIDNLVLNKTFKTGSIKSKNPLVSFENLFLGLPISDIIIYDLYLFYFDEKHPIENNYFKFLKTLKERFQELKTVIIFTNFEKDKKDFRDQIIRKSARILGNQINFRLYDASGRSDYHIRRIFTNYFLIEPELSLNALYNEKDILDSKKSEIRISPYGNPINLENAQEWLNGLYPILIKSNDYIYDDRIKNISSILFLKQDNGRKDS